MRHGREVVKASSNLPHTLYRLLLGQRMQWDFSPAEDVIWLAQAHCKLVPGRERHRAAICVGFVRVCNLVLRYKKGFISKSFILGFYALKSEPQQFQSPLPPSTRHAMRARTLRAPAAGTSEV